jgi:acid phosphatase
MSMKPTSDGWTGVGQLVGLFSTTGRGPTPLFLCRRCIWLVAPVLATIAVASAPLAPVAVHEPANLGRLKHEIRAYVDSGQYDRDIAVVAGQADHWLQERAALGGGRLTVVFDLDETLLSNLPEMRRQDFGYVPAVWDAWVAEGAAPAIPAVLKIYRTARRLGIEVIFLSGRTERDRAGTEKNLRAIGCGDYRTLLLERDDSALTTGAFKLAERRRLQKSGHVIIANVGDQDSDFEGGAAERNFKLPDPFYVAD